MTLVPIIIPALTRDQLKQVVDDLGLDDVDRRRPSSMLKALFQSRRATPEKLLPYLDVPTLRIVCEEVGVPSKGTRQELTEQLFALPVRDGAMPSDGGPMAGQRGKLVLGKGQARFVKRRLLWLPQNNLVLETEFCPLPEILGGRLWIGMAVRQWNGAIQALEILEHVPTVNDLADLLAHAMQSPLSDDGHGRAEGIHLRDNPEWEELFPHLRQLKIEVVLTECLTKWDEAATELIQCLQAWWSGREARRSVSKAELGYEDEMLDLKLTAIMFPCHRRARKRAGGEEAKDK